MKHVLTLLLLLPFSSFKAQESKTDQSKVKEETVLFISGVSNNNCSRTCIRISNVNVQFDDCYDEDSEVFGKDCEAALTDKEVYKMLLNTSEAAWAKLEEEIDENHDINAGLPFIVRLQSKGETKSFILLGIDSFQDKENEVLMKQIRQIFDDWENCVPE